jgi:hypothetical protein
MKLTAESLAKKQQQMSERMKRMHPLRKRSTVEALNRDRVINPKPAPRERKPIRWVEAGVIDALRTIIAELNLDVPL